MKYTEKAMNIVKDYFSKRDQITGQIGRQKRQLPHTLFGVYF